MEYALHISALVYISLTMALNNISQLIERLYITYDENTE